MIAASVMKELKWGKNEEKCWVQDILWSSKILFSFWNEAYIFFSNSHIHNVVSTLHSVVKIDVENDNVVLTLSNIVQFNVEKYNVVSTLFYVGNFNVDIQQRCFNVDLTLCDVAPSYQPKNNVEPTLKCLLGKLCTFL